MAAERKQSQHSGGDGTFAQRNLRFGWWALLAFLSLGFFLEALHGFKVGWYVSVSTEVRREMWTLAHAHGTLLALINIVFGVSVPRSKVNITSLQTASRLLVTAGILLPAGFFLGGVVIYSGDPGLGILLVPLGATALVVAVFIAARQLGSGSSSADSSREQPMEKTQRSPDRAARPARKKR